MCYATYVLKIKALDCIKYYRIKERKRILSKYSYLPDAPSIQALNELESIMRHWEHLIKEKGVAHLF